MAHTIKSKTGSKFYTIEFDPTELWNSATPFPNGMDLLSICMRPAAAGDKVVVRDGADGPEIFSHEAVGAYDHALRIYQSNDPKWSGRGGVHCTPHVAAAEATGNFVLTFEVR